MNANVLFENYETQHKSKEEFKCYKYTTLGR